MVRRSHFQIFSAFLAVHVILSCLAGIGLWQFLDGQMRRQAEDSARSVARMLTEGGFTVNEQVLSRMQQLTGYRFSIHYPRKDYPEYTVYVPFGDGSQRMVEINYRSQDYQRQVRLVFWLTVGLVLSGILIFIPVAWLLARRFARPLERLADSARIIGTGDWSSPIEASGTREIENVAEALEQMRRQLQRLVQENRQAERLATMGTFTATIAHEVRNPLSAIRLTIQMLEQEQRDPRLQQLQDELERLDLIVDELLGYSAGMAVDMQDCVLEDVCSEVLRLLQRQADHAGVSMRTHGQARVRADARRLRQLLMNLVLNAIQVQHGGGSLTVQIQSDGFEVIDQGPGVPADLIDDLFTPFHSRREQGTGLGLHLAVSIAEAHGARLSYERDERGTCFSLRGLQPAETVDAEAK